MASGTAEELAGQAAGDQKTFVTFKGSAEAIEPALRECEIITDLSLIESTPGKVRYAIGSSEEEPEETLFNLAVQNRWTLTELRREAVSLEQIFTRLTTQEPIES